MEYLFSTSFLHYIAKNMLFYFLCKIFVGNIIYQNQGSKIWDLIIYSHPPFNVHFFIFGVSL